jgi:hypothetical protein
MPLLSSVPRSITIPLRLHLGTRNQAILLRIEYLRDAGGWWRWRWCRACSCELLLLLLLFWTIDVHMRVGVCISPSRDPVIQTDPDSESHTESSGTFVRVHHRMSTTRTTTVPLSLSLALALTLSLAGFPVLRRPIRKRHPSSRIIFLARQPDHTHFLLQQRHRTLPLPCPVIIIVFVVFIAVLMVVIKVFAGHCWSLSTAPMRVCMCSTIVLPSHRTSLLLLLLLTAIPLAKHRQIEKRNVPPFRPLTYSKPFSPICETQGSHLVSGIGITITMTITGPRTRRSACARTWWWWRRRMRKRKYGLWRRNVPPFPEI